MTRPAPAIRKTAPPRFAAPTDGRLDGAMRAAYVRDGFLILEDMVSPADCDALQGRIAHLIDGFDPTIARTVFETRTQSHANDAYFLESGEAIRFFFEEGAFDAKGRLTVPTALALNKIGHALHDLDPVFSRVSRNPYFAGLAAALGIAQPLLLQSMYVFKQPQIGGEVGWHQDSTFLYTRPLSAVGFWLALDDAALANGCLTAIPGGHRGPLRHRFRREGYRTRMDDLDSTSWSAIPPAALGAARGTVIVLHGLLPHASAANRSARPRHAYTFHLIDGAAEYPDDNWLRRPTLPLRGFA